PLATDSVYKRGRLIHKLLQHLPDIPPARREAVGQKLMAGTEADMAATCLKEALAVIGNPEFAFLFGEDSMAEVPVAGTVTVAGKPVSVAGQIDRLAVGEAVWIVDYKSNRLPPRE